MGRATLLSLALLHVACATVPEPGGGGENLPNAAAGPFRVITQPELGNLRAAPNVIEDDTVFTRDPAVLDVDGDPDTFGVAGYFAAAVKQGQMAPAADDPTRAILRYEALDARSFDRAAEVVLTPADAWEGGVMGAPSVLSVGGEVFLYYAALGGIGLARSPDGRAFTRVPGPVLGPAMGGWEGSAVPASPGVVRLPDGTFRMFYEVVTPGGETAIGEAFSSDGLSFARTGTAPVLAPRQAVEGQDPPYDGAAVGSPSPMLAVSADGRRILRLYYGAKDASGNGVIGLAARFEGAPEAAFERAIAPVFGTSKPLLSREPCVVVYRDFTLLFATERTSTTMARPAVAAGVAPGTAVLPPPNPL